MRRGLLQWSMTMTARDIPFGSLLPPKGNPRKIYDEASIKGLAQSIAAVGIIQNLVVCPEGKDRFRVVIGKRRFLALKHLRHEGTIDDTYKVPVSIRKKLKERDADRISTVENVQREPMHAIDEAESFAKLLQGGTDITEVAAETGVSVSTVRRRVALASLCDEAKSAVREGVISLTIAEALTLTAADQQRGWIREIVAGAEVDAEDIREEVLSAKPAVAMAVFPVERYTGTLARDLFADEESTYFDDVEQFIALQRQAVEERMTEHRAAGTPVELVQGYSPPWWQYRPAQECEAGSVVIHFAPNGAVEMRKGLVRHPVDAKSAEVTAESPIAPNPRKERPRYTAATMRYVALRQSIAVQAALLSDHRAAKEATAAILLLGHESGPWARLRLHESIAALSKEAPRSRGYLAVVAQSETLVEQLNGSSIKGKNTTFEAWQRLLHFRVSVESTYDGIRKLTDAALDQLIAYCVVVCFGRTAFDRAESEGSLFNHVGHHLAVDFRRYWMPDRAFLSGLSRDDLKATAIESGASVGLPKLGAMKKQDLVESLARYFERTADPSVALDEHDRKGRDWVPECMALLPVETSKTRKRAA